MHYCAVRFLMLSVFVLGATAIAQSVKATTRSDACREVQQELDRCITQSNTCDKDRTYANAEAIAKKAHDNGEFQPELDYLWTCFMDITSVCADIRQATSAFAGDCRQATLEPNRTCSVSPCSGWSLTAYIEGDCVLTWCKSNEPHRIQLP